jgi:uncharacterized membrane protein
MIFNEKSHGFWIAIVGIIVLLGISLAAVFRYAGVADASGVVMAAGTVIGTVVGTFTGQSSGADGSVLTKSEQGDPTVRTHASVDSHVGVKSEREKSVAVDRVLLIYSD